MYISLSVVRNGAGLVTDGVSVCRNSGVITIGRSPDNDLPLNDPERYVSRKHAVVSCGNGNFLIKDISVSGTIINHQQTPLIQAEAPLLDGYLLQIGEYEIKVSICSMPAAESIPIQSSAFHSELMSNDTTGDMNSEFDRVSPSDLGEELAATPSNGIPSGEDSFSFFDSDGMADTSPANSQSFTPPVLNQPDSPNDISDFTPGDIDSWFSDEIPPPEQAGAHENLPAQQIHAHPEHQNIPAVQDAPADTPAFHDPHDCSAAPAGPPQSTEISNAGVQAFFEGMGISEPLAHSPEEQQQMMHSMGSAFREMVIGMMAVLEARSDLKNEFRMSVTTMAPVRNNALKCFTDPDEVIKTMLNPPGQGFMGVNESVQEGFYDIKAHQIAVTAGMQAALRALLDRFNPATLEGNLKSNLIIQKKAKYWDIFTEEYEKIAKEAEDNFNDLFGDEFASVYQEQVRKMRSGGRR